MDTSKRRQAIRVMGTGFMSALEVATCAVLAEAVLSAVNAM
jgi:hypothetical protein